VEPREAAIRFWLDPIPPEEMPMLAARMLAEGGDTPALRRAAGYSRRDDPRDIREEFGQALDELGAWLPDRGAAEPAAGMPLPAPPGAFPALQAST
jgi:hypothetical protein